MNDDKLTDVLTYKLTYDKLHYWLRFAKLVEDAENPCYSRKIGVVIVDRITGDLVSIGHNGPPENCPPCDDKDYLQNVVWPQLSSDERLVAFDKVFKSVQFSELEAEGGKLGESWFSEFFAGCKTCPRRLVNAPSGKRLELCTCAHAEHNAIVKAHRSVVNCVMICHCGVPCIECCKTIINSKISFVIAIKQDKEDYSPYSSRWMLEKAQANLILLEKDFYLNF
jgi:deoxycytidylate deaminase